MGNERGALLSRVSVKVVHDTDERREDCRRDSGSLAPGTTEAHPDRRRHSNHAGAPSRIAAPHLWRIPRRKNVDGGRFQDCGVAPPGPRDEWPINTFLIPTPSCGIWRATYGLAR